MGEENRCKKCKKPIDGDGDICSDCRFTDMRDGNWTSSEHRKLMYERGDRRMSEINDMMKNDNLG